jgi:hypothetical protein
MLLPKIWLLLRSNGDDEEVQTLPIAAYCSQEQIEYACKKNNEQAEKIRNKEIIDDGDNPFDPADGQISFRNSYYSWMTIEILGNKL